MDTQIKSLDTVVELVRQGDREAFRTLIQQCEAPIRIVIAAILPVGAEVEDVTQEVFIIAYRKLDQYRLNSDFLAWIKSIARHQALNSRRGWARRMASESATRAQIDAVLECETLDVSQEVLPALHSCMETLAPLSRQVVREHYFASRTPSEIASAQGRPAGWARLVLHRARLALHECLRRQGAVLE